MDIYDVMLFAHLLGAIGFLAPLGVWLVGLTALRRAARVEQVQILCRAIFLTDRVAVAGILLLGAAGFYMALTTWSLETGWIAVATASFILMAPIGPLIVERRLHAIAALAHEESDGALSETLRRRIDDPLMGAALYVMIALLLGIIFLMTVKPLLQVAVAVMLASLALGLVAGLPLWRRAPDVERISVTRSAQ